MDIFQWILQDIYFKDTFFTGFLQTRVLGELPRGKFPLVKLPRRESPPLQIPPWWISPRNISPKKIPHGKLPCIYQCIPYASFIKNEAWTCHWIKFSFACFLKFFLLHCALWISSNCESVGSLVNIGLGNLTVYEPCHVASVYFLK